MKAFLMPEFGSLIISCLFRKIITVVFVFDTFLFIYEKKAAATVTSWSQG